MEEYNLQERRNDPEIQKLTDSFGDWFKGGCKNEIGNAARMTQELYPYTSTFSPIQVGKMQIKNRVVMAPMGNLMMCEENGRLTSAEEVHHILPISLGGTHDKSNLMSLCKSCHNKIHLELGDRQIRK